MEIQAGQYYRTRDGFKAQVVCIAVNEHDGEKYAVGWIGGNVYCWFADGRYSRFGETPADLIAPWPEEADPWDYEPHLGEVCWVTNADRSVTVLMTIPPWGPRDMRERGYRFAKAEPPPVKGAGE